MLSGAHPPSCPAHDDQHAACRPAAEAAGVKASDVCWIFCTSGSEGVPRGVLTTHSAAVNYVKFHPLLHPLQDSADGGGSSDGEVRVLLWSARTFDPSAGDVFATLARGGVVCLWQESPAPGHPAVDAPQPLSRCEHTAPAAHGASSARQWMSGTEAGGLRLTDLTQALVDSRATHVCTTPSLWSRVSHVVLGGGHDARPKFLRVVGLGGEVMPLPLARRWSSRLRLVNLYGCTECTV